MAETHARTFRMECSVEVCIRAQPDVLWARLTDAAGFPSWNSTVTELVGPIEKGRRLAIRATASPNRTFRPTVTEFERLRPMRWADGTLPFFRGVRTFTLTPEGDNTRFAMEEVFEGWMLPLIRPSLPDFGPTFDRYAEDLRRACEDRV